MRLQLIDIVNIIGTFQLLVFILFLMRRKSERSTGYWQQPNRLLSLFLLIQVCLLLGYEGIHLQEHVIRITPHLLYLGIPFMYLAAPVFFLYVRSLAFSDFRFRKADLLHLLPFVAVWCVMAQQFFLLPAEEKITLLAGGREFSQAFWIAFNAVFVIQFSIYFFADLRILRVYREEIRQQYSSVHRINLTWLTVMLYGFILAWLSSVASAVARSYFQGVYDQMVLANFLAFFCFFNFIFYKGLSQPEIFSGVVERPRYEASRLTADEGKRYHERLSVHMESTKPYLDPGLTLKDLASQVSLPPRYLSQIINEYSHRNFYDYVNQFRIEEAKRQLADKTSGRNISEILYAVGFNSKSSFNTAFKEATGVSPSHFRKQAITARA
jgi:AraC-like DNA-binding protein